MYSKHNNPEKYPQKYFGDCGERMTLGELEGIFVAAARDEASDKELCKLIDQEFLFGCWRDQMEPRDPDFLRNLRGLIINLSRGAAGRSEVAPSSTPKLDPFELLKEEGDE